MKAIKIIPTLFLLFVLPLQLLAASSDSLHKLVEQISNPNRKVIMMLELSNELFASDIDKGIENAIYAAKIARQHRDFENLGFCFKTIGLGHYYKSNDLEALLAWEKALNIFDSIQHTVGSSNMLSNIGAIYFNQGSYEKALNYYLQSYKLANEANDTLRILTVLTNIGAVYTEIPGSQALALDYANKAMKLSLLEGDNNAIATNALNIAELYLLEKDFPLAIEYYTLSADKGEAEVRLQGLIGLAKAKAATQDYDEALQLLEEVEEIAFSLGLRQALVNAIETRASLYNSQMAYQTAIPEFKKALKISKELKYLNVIKSCYSGLKSSYANLRQYDSAFKYQSLYAVIDDSIYTIETNKRLNNQLFGFEIEKKQNEINLLKKDQALQEVSIKKQRVINGLAGAGFLSVAIFLAIAFRQKKKISAEKERSDELLLNILPFEVAEELKQKGESTARSYQKATVLFTDFKEFTNIAESMDAKSLVQEIHICFRAFDAICEKYGIEKIKTIGDAYLAAGGINDLHNSDPADVVKAGLEMQAFITSRKAENEAANKAGFEMRVGIHTGPVVAGIVGVKKFQYDIWGDTVNTSSRMESSGEVGKVNISQATYELLKGDSDFSFESRGKIEAKGKGEIEMWFVSLKASSLGTN